MKALWIGLLLLAAGGTATAASAIETVLQDGHTVLFIAVNILLTAYFIIRFDRFAAVHGPEIVTTVGILGCFFGIALALVDFDTANVSASVPQLLNGVKTAFWASVSGVVGALLIRLRQKLQRASNAEATGASQPASLSDVVSVLRGLQASLAGNTEGSLLSQLKLMRQDQADQLQALRTSFDKYAESMAEQGSKALVEALRQVITDFNAKISEQFGENFKHLNEGVAKLVIWQDQYRKELDRSQLVNASSAQALNLASDRLGKMVEQSEGFVDAAKSLEALVKTLPREYDLLVASQKALGQVLVAMRDVTPTFTAKIEEMIASISAGSAKTQEQVLRITSGMAQHLEASETEIRRRLADAVESMRISTAESGEQMAKSARDLGVQLEGSQAALESKALDLLARMHMGSERVAKEIGIQLTHTLEALTEATQKVGEEMSASAKSVGTQLQGTQLELKTRMIELTETMKLGTGKVSSEVTDITKNLGSQLQASHVEMKSLLQDTVKKSGTDVNAQLTQSLELVKQGVQTLDRGLQEELNKSLETLGRQMASLSEKFVSDYSPLTDRLREVVRIAEGVN